MKYILNNIVVFACGAAVGSVITWKILKEKYARIAQEEINEVREHFAKRLKELGSEKETTDEVKSERNFNDVSEEEVERDQYVDVLKNTGYANKEVEFMAKPYVISPDMFGENGDEYETISLTYYADGVLADDMDEPIDDIDDIVGKDSLNHFGEYEDDSVFVRNERMRCDYEILRDTRKYSEVKKLYYPHQTEE